MKTSGPDRILIEKILYCQIVKFIEMKIIKLLFMLSVLFLYVQCEDPVINDIDRVQNEKILYDSDGEDDDDPIIMGSNDSDGEDDDDPIIM